MTEPREAACQCGQLRVVTSGEPRDAGQVEVSGRYSDFDPIRGEPAFVALVQAPLQRQEGT
jgi:hypothetical protein